MKTTSAISRKLLVGCLVMGLSLNAAGFDARTDSAREIRTTPDSLARTSVPAATQLPVLDFRPVEDLGESPMDRLQDSDLQFSAGLEARIPESAAILESSPPRGPLEKSVLPGRQSRLDSVFSEIRAATRLLAFSPLYDANSFIYDAGNFTGANEQVAPTFASGVVHGRLEPLKLRHGVKRVAPFLRAPADDRLKRRFFYPSTPAARREAPMILNANPRDPEAIERALRALFESNPRIFGLADETKRTILTHDDLALVHATPVNAGDGRADTVHAVFRQVRKGTDENGQTYFLPVYGASLSLTFKVLNDQLALMALDGHLYPIQVDMTPRFSNDILDSAAQQRLMPVTTVGRTLEKFRSLMFRSLRMTSKSEGPKPEFITREVIPDEAGQWHAANIYQGSDLKGQPINVAVDVATGEAFAWNARGLRLNPKRPPLPAPARPASVSVHLVKADGLDSSVTSVSVLGRGNEIIRGEDHGPVGAMPMPHLKIRDARGNLLGVTDENGRLALGDGAIDVTVAAEGQYAAVTDAHWGNPPLKIILRLATGHDNRIVLNPTSDSAELAGQINSYLSWNLLREWMKSIGVTHRDVDDTLVIHNNKGDMPCNAYYDPFSDTLNLERENEDCENTAQPSILLHESGHRYVMAFARVSERWLKSAQARLALFEGAFRYMRRGFDFVMGGGVNEGTADTISMYYRSNPKVGEGLFKRPGPDTPLVIRDGRNRKLYQAGEVHDEGESLMGATWEIYDEIQKALGEAAGAAYAAAMVIPTLVFSQPRDVPAALAQILLAAMHKDGSSPFAAIVRRAAERRGIPLPIPVESANDNVSQILSPKSSNSLGNHKPAMKLAA